MIVCEVQEYSDLTYRVYDYGRVDAHGKPRELHIEKALQVTNFGAIQRRKSIARLPLPGGSMKNDHLLAACPFFATERWEFDFACALSKSDAGALRACSCCSWAGSGHISLAGFALSVSSQANAGCIPAYARCNFAVIRADAEWLIHPHLRPQPVQSARRNYAKRTFRSAW